MTNESVRFSVIIPVYNASKLLSKCLDSLVAQTFKNFEVIALDDESKDNSFEILKRFKADNQQMKINISTHKNCGAGKTRNIGLSLAKGEYIVFLDSDDYLDTDYLERINNIIESKQSDVVFIDIIREDENGHLIRYERMSDFKDLSKDRMIKWQLTGKMPWGGWRKVIKTDIIRNNKLEYAPIKVGEESIFSFLTLLNAKEISFQQDSFYHYVDAANSLTSHDNVSNPQSVFDFISGYIKNSSYYEEYNTTVNALGVTTVAILVNILANENSFFNAIKESRSYINKYKPYITGGINYDALEKRIKYCYPFMRIGMATPIIFGSYIQKLSKKIKHLLK